MTVAIVRSVLLAVMLCLGVGVVPLRWAVMWLAIPAAVALALLLTWRYGRGGLAFPAVLAIATAVAWFALGGAAFPLWLGGWIPIAALTGAWMGLHEEGGGPELGDRVWMLVPLLALAAALPVMPGFRAAMTRLDALAAVEQARALRDMVDAPAWWKDGMKQQLAAPALDRQRFLLTMVPAMLFFWMALLVQAGRSFAARAATLLRWPPVSRSPFARWRLPDGALVPLIAGLALAVLAPPAWQPTAWVLLMVASLGYILQGVAVVGSLLVSRGMPPAFAALTLLFVMVVSLMMILPAIAVVGLSDVWLDHRRLEPAPKGEA